MNSDWLSICIPDCIVSFFFLSIFLSRYSLYRMIYLGNEQVKKLLVVYFSKRDTLKADKLTNLVVMVSIRITLDYDMWLWCHYTDLPKDQQYWIFKAIYNKNTKEKLQFLDETSLPCFLKTGVSLPSSQKFHLPSQDSKRPDQVLKYLLFYSTWVILIHCTKNPDFQDQTLTASLWARQVVNHYLNKFGKREK